MARNITGAAEGWLRAKTLLLAYIDTKFTAQFRSALAAAGMASVRLPILCGLDSLRRALREYVAHYNGERNHQGIGNELARRLAPARRYPALRR